MFGGKLTKPERSGLFYIPQRPYLMLGTLRELGVSFMFNKLGQDPRLPNHQFFT
ncbi:hypothetical protein PR001_g223 [Phytophthora rubi]|uniref:Uncharacterized protein n=1 Tax=Phytophthora rubi TaxID=129364 RepID=A0A6A3P3Y6_9STRA|nr:hypothetical protein PR002_g453 [Phytophthora rubi]KAE9052730.1 hypothetical protein PR001_g223 [Phytophthora rubi]